VQYIHLLKLLAKIEQKMQNAKCKMQNLSKKFSQLCEIISAITGVYIFQ